MNTHLLLRSSRSELDGLLSALEIDFVKMAECLVSPGWRLVLDGNNAPGIHYNLRGIGRMTVGGGPPIDLRPHTLVIAPSIQLLEIEVPVMPLPAPGLATVKGTLGGVPTGLLQRIVAGNGAPEVILICGYFRARYGASIDLFAKLSSPIVEQFDASDRVDDKLKSALAELTAQEVGAGAMTAALLKQVLVTVLRRSLGSLDLWVERFSMLGDRNITRAFADMVARPGASHSVRSLAQTAGLSRSAFMARFNSSFGRSPMAVLRQLRMRYAASRLSTNTVSIDQAAHEVGYTSRGSFLKAFKKTFGCDPSQYRAEKHSFDEELPPG
jgi:AraC family transcriptional regulator, activator of mtrCDE